MQENHFIKSFSLLGKELKKLNNPLIMDAMHSARIDNPLFTCEMQTAAMNNIADKFLQNKQLQWLIKHADNNENNLRKRGGNLWQKTIGIVMAGNLPLVGFHDLLCTLACGRNAFVKLSSKDYRLLPAVYEALCDIDNYWCGKVIFYSDFSLLSNDKPCAIIASGSDDSMDEIRKKSHRIPKLLRGSRFSFAVLNGSEDERQLEGLAEDMLLYFGLGCRSVSYLLVPEDYDFKALIKAANKSPKNFRQIMMAVDAYKNSYLRIRAVNMMENGCIDGGFFILRKSESFHPPLAQVNFEYYKNNEEIKAFENMYKNKIQKKYTTFGIAQRPEIDDFSDGSDTVQFILKH